MDIAEPDSSRSFGRAFTSGVILTGLSSHGESSEYLVVDWKILGYNMVRNLIIGALDHLVFEELLEALEAEGVAAREGDGLLVVVVVGLEANSALKYLLHGVSGLYCCYEICKLSLR